MNESWISDYFEIEEVDRELAKNPGKIIDEGGYIFSYLHGESVVGVVALFKSGKDEYELARMAVHQEHRGKGLGAVLMEACLQKADDLNAKRVFLVSNTKLEAAIALYKETLNKSVNLA